MKNFKSTFLASAIVACLPVGLCSAQSADPKIIFIKLNDNIGYVIDSAENQLCRCIPYIKPKDYRYGVLAQLPDYRVVFKIKLANRSGYRNVNLSETEVGQLYSSASVINPGSSVIDAKEEAQLLKEMAGETVPYQLIDYQQFKFPVIPEGQTRKQPEALPASSRTELTKPHADYTRAKVKPPADSSRPELKPRTNLTQKTARNCIAFNILGDGSIMSIDLENFFGIGPRLFWSGKIGIGYAQATTHALSLFGPNPDTPPEYLVTIPHQITANLGKKDIYFEAGLGGTLLLGSNSRYFLYPVVGFRMAAWKTVYIRIFGNIPLFKKDFGEIFSKGYIFFCPVGISLGICF